VTRSVFASAPDDPQLVGQRVAQVPNWQLGAVLERDTPRTLAARLEARAVGEQFDDDLNQFRLAPYGILNVTLRRALGAGAEAFLAGDNLLNAEYDVGRTPARTIGALRTVRAGVTLSLE